MNALPILLLGGAAVMLMAGGKKKKPTAKGKVQAVLSRTPEQLDGKTVSLAVDDVLEIPVGADPLEEPGWDLETDAPDVEQVNRDGAWVWRVTGTGATGGKRTWLATLYVSDPMLEQEIKFTINMEG